MKRKGFQNSIPELDPGTVQNNKQTNKQNPGTRVSDVDAFEDPNMQFSPSPNLNPIPRVIVIFTTQLGVLFLFYWFLELIVSASGLAPFGTFFERFRSRRFWGSKNVNTNPLNKE